MRRRFFLLITIVLMCVLVAVGGSVTFVNSNGILMTDKKSLPKVPPKDLKILVDITENRMFLVSGNEILRTYPVGTGKTSTPSPIGDWVIVAKDNWGKGFGGYWMQLNVPWGKYGIHGTTQPYSIGASISQGCIRMYNEDVEELYKFVRHGTPVKVYGGPFGPFGYGLRILEPGDRGADVYTVQKRLQLLGYFKGYVNGIYGEDMKLAVHKYQREHNLTPSNAIGYSFYNKIGIFLFD